MKECISGFTINNLSSWKTHLCIQTNTDEMRIILDDLFIWILTDMSVQLMTCVFTTFLCNAKSVDKPFEAKVILKVGKTY